MAATVTRRRSLGAADAIWLRMDRPENLLVIDVLLFFDGTVDRRRLRRLLTERVVEPYPVFRCRAVEPLVPLGPPRWVEDPDFDVDRHLVVARLPGRGGDAALRAYVERRMSEPFDPGRPLWQVHLLHGYHPDDGRRSAGRAGAGSVVLARMHHAVADGIALAQVLLSLTDPVDEPGAAGASGPDAGDGRDGRDGRDRAADHPGPAGPHLFDRLVHLARPGTAVDAMTLAWQVGRVADKLLLKTLPRTPLSVPFGPAKHAAWSRPYDLGDVKAAARAAGATVNDLLVAAVGSAVGRYLDDRGGPPRDLTVMVPVNVRRPGEPLPAELGNRFALVLLPLVSGPMDAVARLAETRRRTLQIKDSPEATLTFGVMGAIGLLPPDLERPLVEFFSDKAIGVLTNVIGPTRPRALGGVRLTGVLGWVPQAGDQTLGVCIFSYAGTVRIGFRVAADAVPDPQRLVADVDAAVEELLALARP